MAETETQTCWLCESSNPTVRNLVWRAGPFKPDEVMDVNPDNMRQVPCGNDEFHGQPAN
jgi:hypothetical protein